MKKRMLSYLMTGMLLLTMIPSMAFAVPTTLPELPIMPDEYFKGPFLIEGIQEPVAGDRISTMLSPTISSKTEGETEYLRIDRIVWEYWDHETQRWQSIESPDEKRLTFQVGVKYCIEILIRVKEHEAPFKGFFAPILKKMRLMGDENMPQENAGENPPEVYFGDKKGTVYRGDTAYQLISRYEFGPIQAPAAPVNSGASAGGSSGAQSSVRPDSAGSSSSQEATASQSTTPSTSAQPTTTQKTETTAAPIASETSMFAESLPLPAEVKAVLKIGSTDYRVNETSGTQKNSADVAPMIREGRTVLPARMISELLGVKVEYDNGSKKATLNYNKDGKDAVIELTLGQKTMTVNGAQIALTTDVAQVNGRIMLPLTDIQKALQELGLEITIEWNNATKEVVIK